MFFKRINAFLTTTGIGVLLVGLVVGLVSIEIYEKYVRTDHPATKEDVKSIRDSIATKEDVKSIRDSIIATLHQDFPQLSDTKETRAAILEEVVAIVAALKTPADAKPILNGVNKSLSVGNLAAAERLLLDYAEHAAQAGLPDDLLAAKRALTALYNIEGSPASKIAALQGLTLGSIRGSQAISPTGAPLSPSDPPPKASSGSNSRGPAFASGLPSVNNMLVYPPGGQIDITFSGDNLDLLRSIRLDIRPEYAKPDTAGCPPSNISRSYGTVDWARNVTHQSAGHLTLSFQASDITQLPGSMCLWKFSWVANGSYSYSFPVLYKLVDPSPKAVTDS